MYFPPGLLTVATMGRKCLCINWIIGDFVLSILTSRQIPLQEDVTISGRGDRAQRTFVLPNLKNHQTSGNVVKITQNVAKIDNFGLKIAKMFQTLRRVKKFL